jgi:outer membrane usher protein
VRALEHPATAIPLNPTGHTINMPVPLRYGREILGDVVVTIDQHDQVLLAATDIAPYLKGHLPKSSMETLQGFGPAPLPLSLFSDMDGLNISFNQQSMELTISVAADKSAPKSLSLSRNVPLPSLMNPATISAFLNYDLALSQDWTFEQASGFSLDLEGAMRLGGLVLEAEGTLGGSLNGFLCPIEAKCREQEENHFTRLGTRAVFDIADWNTRSIAGDTTYLGIAGQRPMDLLGVSLQHNPEIFAKQRSQSTRSFGQLLIIDGDADLELVVNGIPMQRLPLKAGAYSLHDLPISLGANTIEAVITYANGEKEVIQFDALSNYQLLDAGDFTWGVSGGLPSAWVNGERQYLDHFQGGLHLRHGLTDTFTGYLALQTDSTIHNAGLGFHHLTSFGTLHLGTTLSQGAGIGYAASASFETLPDLDTPRRSFRIAADYYSDDFRQPGDAQLLAGDVLYPAFDTSLRVTAVHTNPLLWDAYATTTARYDFAADVSNIPGAVSTGTDRWSVDLGISRDFFNATTLTFTAGYGNDRLLSFSRLDDTPEFRFGLNLYARFGESTVSARHSFGNEVSSVTASHLARSPSDVWQASITADNAPERGLYSTASAQHLGQRGETRLSHTTQKPQDAGEHHRTQLQHGGALAFADGKLAIGAPVRNGFAIVYPHSSISEADIIVGNPDAPRATGSWWFPAIVTDLPAYAPVNYSLDAANIPEGYSLNSSHMTVQAPYRAGYALALGSDMPLTAYGTLVDAVGKPLALKQGTATSPAYLDKTIDVFTNSSGKFAAEGLAPGSWSIALNSLTYRFTIPASTRGLFNTDVLRPEGAEPDVPPNQWPATLLTEAQ